MENYNYSILQCSRTEACSILLSIAVRTPSEISHISLGASVDLAGDRPYRRNTDNITKYSSVRVYIILTLRYCGVEQCFCGVSAVEVHIDHV